MSKWIAERKLLCVEKKSKRRFNLLVRIAAPVAVEQNAVEFAVDPGTSVCVVEILGGDIEITESIYGADSIQALQLAADVDPILKRVSSKVDIYFADGDPYFDD